MERVITSVDAGWWVVSHEQKIWLPNGELPFGTAETWDLAGSRGAIIGEWHGEPVWLIRENRSENMGSIRQIIDLDSGLFQLAGRGVQLAEFIRSHRYCGYCGHEMHLSNSENACLCGHCRQRYYPQIAPCIIVAIRRDDKILLAQHARHRNSIYTVLAGFVEVGETLEQAVAREVMEESNVRVKNLRYVTSQPWPFPHSLMMAFMAEYDEGELQIDNKELIDANWFRYDALPQLPPAGTVARRLIEDTVALCRAADEQP
ncbi:MAG: NAD(+) diphosphatase [Mixta calida]|uniref:NAD(+) diphosphatase n=1 Tax=Mixta TaxID=2100764 RepID=UPI000535B66E|nr:MULTISPECIES: NAD(+) diphosphatase [Mixta]AIX75724.1 NADH pyrophosphatase [Pantoea sp. PSNIH2]MDU3818719.1 NAD(+) diphosphatase [Pantoea sp.]POU41310.1 NAD(+) diphosphatase [Pantoea sp. PSNIH5]POU59019.1 NAD(+) diphosphatase [Pantoea sp. PSNIH4]POY65812.1 NAD(+) diphosphatase [Pantoea sp. PSNIH3]HCW47569.1 NAD(+) diphosphatase [Erwiniaceae bacterium]